MSSQGSSGVYFVISYLAMSLDLFFPSHLLVARGSDRLLPRCGVRGWEESGEKRASGAQVIFFSFFSSGISQDSFESFWHIRDGREAGVSVYLIKTAQLIGCIYPMSIFVFRRGTKNLWVLGD